jgi:hypothetical protein
MMKNLRELLDYVKKQLFEPDTQAPLANQAGVMPQSPLVSLQSYGQDLLLLSQALDYYCKECKRGFQTKGNKTNHARLKHKGETIKPKNE